MGGKVDLFPQLRKNLRRLTAASKAPTPKNPKNVISTGAAQFYRAAQWRDPCIPPLSRHYSLFCSFFSVSPGRVYSVGGLRGCSGFASPAGTDCACEVGAVGGTAGAAAGALAAGGGWGEGLPAAEAGAVAGWLGTGWDGTGSLAAGLGSVLSAAGARAIAPKSIGNTLACGTSARAIFTSAASWALSGGRL